MSIKIKKEKKGQGWLFFPRIDFDVHFVDFCRVESSGSGSRVYTACVKKNRQSALQSAICIRFQIGLKYWIPQESMKNCLKNYGSELISNDVTAFPALYVGVGAARGDKTEKSLSW